jgi:hypothetical protein
MTIRMVTHESWAMEVVEFREVYPPQAVLRSTCNTPEMEVMAFGKY